MDPVSKSQLSPSRERSLANLKPWAKGQSGNPAGRPKTPAISEIYLEIFDDPKMREAIKQQAYKTMSAAGMAGVLERREAAERLEGKVKENVDMNLSGNLILSEVIAERRKKRGNSES